MSVSQDELGGVICFQKLFLNCEQRMFMSMFENRENSPAGQMIESIIPPFSTGDPQRIG